MAALNASPPDARPRAQRRRNTTGASRKASRDTCSYRSPLPVDYNRPDRRIGPACGYKNPLDGDRATPCPETGWHYCQGRADRAVAFIERILVHTKGRHSRKAFLLAPWQLDGIVRPLFGEVRWSEDHACYVRRFTSLWLEVARKNGKSELLAALALLLLVADDEEGGEIYGCALDIPQAKKVFDVAAKMVKLSPLLSARLTVKTVARRIVDHKTDSYYEVVPADAAGNLGHNPSGVVFDEVLTQPNGDLWDALRTGSGTRTEPLFIAATTAGNDPNGFCSDEHKYAERILEAPELDPYKLVVLYNVPADADPFNEDVWPLANPALGDFLSWEQMRQEANEARNEPRKLRAFCMYRLNQWRDVGTRWITTERFEKNTTTVHATPPVGILDPLAGARAFGGLDLASTSDLVALAWLLPLGRPDESTSSARWIWRHFTPEAALPNLNAITSGNADLWVEAGHLTITEGDFVDYDVIHTALEEGLERFAVESIGIDRWNSAATTTWFGKEFPDVDVGLVGQGFASTTEPLSTMERMMARGDFAAGDNPLARWCFTSCEVKEDDHGNIKPIKPRRKRARHRIDTVSASVNAFDGWLRNPEPPEADEAYGF